MPVLLHLTWLDGLTDSAGVVLPLPSATPRGIDRTDRVFPSRGVLDDRVVRIIRLCLKTAGEASNRGESELTSFRAVLDILPGW